ncbi:MAG TPA: hypothetical protein VI479_17735 [Blastocatellia bacterium]
MIPLRSQTGIRLRAALAMLLLLAGAIAPAAGLWAPEPVTCGMACCEASGVCYCRHNHAGEAEAAGADTDTAKFTAVVVNSSCPAQCAKLPAGFQKYSIARAHPPRFAFVAGATRKLFIHTPFLALDTLISEAHSPRAPPDILL